MLLRRRGRAHRLRGGLLLKPCRECPFNRSFERKCPSFGILLFLDGVLADDDAPCHMSHDDNVVPCAGAAMFKEGGHPEVISSVREFMRARAQR